MNELESRQAPNVDDEKALAIRSHFPSTVAGHTHKPDTVDEARAKFLKTIQQIGLESPTSRAGQILPSLHSDVYPLYQRLARSTDHNLDQSSVLTSWQILDALAQDKPRTEEIQRLKMRIVNLPRVDAGSADAESQDAIQTLLQSKQQRLAQLIEEDCRAQANEDLRVLHQALIKWAETWPLTAEWCFDYALNTLSTWSRQQIPVGSQVAPEKLDWESVLWGFVSIEIEAVFEFQFYRWHSNREPWKDYEKRLNEAFKKHKAWYRQAREIDQSQRGKARSKHGDNHYRWLVEFYINRKSWPDVVKGQNCTQDHAEGAANELKSFIGLPHVQRKGRPKKRKN